MKLYSFLGCLYFLIFICVLSTTWGLPYEKRSSHTDFNINRKRNVVMTVNSKLKYLLHNMKDIQLHLNDDVTLVLKNSSYLEEDVKYTTPPKNSGNVREYKNRNNGEDVSLAEALTQNSEAKSSINMVLPIAGTITVLFSMSILVALFQCCCRKKRQTSDTEDVKTSNDKLVDSRKSSENEVPRKEEKPPEETKREENEEKNEVVSIRAKIAAFEGALPTQPSPGPIRPTKKRPESNAFKAFENQGIIIGMGKSPSKLPKTPEDENQNATVSQEVEKKAELTTPPEDDDNDDSEDDLGDYKQPDNPDVVIADVDEGDEFSAITRDTSVLRSYKKAPPPKNRNRSSAAVRRKRARETTTDLLFNDSSDNSFLNVPDDLEIVYTDNSNKTEENGNKTNSTERHKNMKDKSDSMERNKTKTEKIDSMEKNKNKKDKSDSTERSKNKKDKNKKDDKSEVKETPSIVTSDYSDDNIIDISKQEVPPEVFSGGNIFMHIDPTFNKKNAATSENKPATPPTTRLRTSHLNIEERKEKAKSTPLLSSHEDIAKALGKLKSPSKENNKDKTSVINRSSSDLSSNTHL